MVSVVWAFGKVFGGGSGRVRQSPECSLALSTVLRVLLGVWGGVVRHTEYSTNQAELLLPTLEQPEGLSR